MNPNLNHALFQVASQFNLLEMPDPEVKPEDGIHSYNHDMTQGPACALSAAAGTLYRNYFVKVDPDKSQRGQTQDHQIYTLAGIEKALNVKFPQQNGYIFPTSKQILEVSNQINQMNLVQREELIALHQVGIQWNTEVTLVPGQNQFVQQVYCSAVPVAYHNLSDREWEALACLILDAAYEATLLSAIINQAKTGSSEVFLTLLGGGAFGNHPKWIYDAIEKAVKKIPQTGLKIQIVSYGHANPEINQLINKISLT